MLVYQDLLSGDELLSDSFPYKEIQNGILWEVEGKWVVKGSVDVDIGANPSAEGCEDDEGVNDESVKVVDIIDTFRLQEQPSFDKKTFLAFMKKYIKNLTEILPEERKEEFKKSVEAAVKWLLAKLKDLQLLECFQVKIVIQWNLMVPTLCRRSVQGRNVCHLKSVTGSLSETEKLQFVIWPSRNHCSVAVAKSPGLK